MSFNVCLKFAFIFLCFFFYSFDIISFLLRSDTESHVEVNKNEKRKYTIYLNSLKLNKLFKKRAEKSEAPNTDVEEGKLSNDEEENAAPSESTVIIEDEPAKKVKLFFISI